MAIGKEQTVSLRGRKIKLWRGGSGPQVLFLHDSFCPAWLPLHDKLAADFEVILPIHPGLAGSEENFDDFDSMEDLLFHYLDLCDLLGLQRPALAGSSLGGWLAAEWAIRYGERLSKLILIDALGLRIAGAPAADALSLDGPALRQALFADANAPLALATLPDTPQSEDMVPTILARRTLARFAWQFPDNPKLFGYLYRIDIPTQVIWGERDGYVDAAHGRAYHQGIARSRLATIAGAGHLPHVEAAERCAALMADFLQGGAG
jgi:pimeloyl-ACP methyl ester carboxylesterase